nr:hypothetical protein [Chloroflexota bacterium]
MLLRLRAVVLGLALAAVPFLLLPSLGAEQRRGAGPSPSASGNSQAGLRALLGSAGDDLGYVDRILAVHLGAGGRGNPEAVLHRDPQRGALVLGTGGFLAAGFTNNLLVNSGDRRPDLVILGEFSSIQVAIRPADQETRRATRRMLPDQDGDGYLELGVFHGGPILIDLDELLRARWWGEYRFDAVLVRDVSDGAIEKREERRTDDTRLDGILAATLEVLPEDVVSRELSIQIQSEADLFLPVDVVSRELSIQQQSADDLFLPLDAISRELSVRVLSAVDDFLPFDVVSRELSVQVFDFDGEGPLDVISREMSVFVPGGVDLVVGSISAPSATETDEPVQVSWFDRNIGNAPATGSWVDRISFSTDGTLEGIVASHDHPVSGPLAAGQNVSLVTTVPAPSTPGTYWILAQVDATNLVAEEFGEGSEDNNLRVADAPTTVEQTPRPALQVQDLTPPASASPREQIEVAWWTHNAGTAPATGSWTEAILLTAGPRGARPVTLAVVPFSGTLAPGESVLRSALVTLPASMPLEPWLVVCTNAGSELILLPGTETCATVELCATCEHPDVIVSLLDAPRQAEAGQTVAVQWAVLNQGNGEALAPWTSAIELLREADGAVVASVTQLHDADLA